MLESSQRTAGPVKNGAVSKNTGVEQARAMTASGGRGMDTLETGRRIASGAFHGSGEKIEPPKCQPRNRTAILYVDKGRDAFNVATQCNSQSPDDNRLQARLQRSQAMGIKFSRDESRLSVLSSSSERDGFNVANCCNFQFPMKTDCKLDSSVVRKKMMIQKRKSESMIQGNGITISGGKLTNVGGDYHEHNTTYVVEEAPTYRGYLETLQLEDRFKNLENIVDNLNLLVSSPKEDNTKSDGSSRRTPSRMENENMSDTSSSNHVTEIQSNSLNDLPQPTSVFDDGYCIYQTPAPSRINDFTPNSRAFSAMAQDGRNLSSSGNQHPYPFGYMPILVPGIACYFPCQCFHHGSGGFLPGLAGYLLLGYDLHSFEYGLHHTQVTRYGHKFLDSGRYLYTGEPHTPTSGRSCSCSSPSTG